MAPSQPEADDVTAADLTNPVGAAVQYDDSERRKDRAAADEEGRL